MEGINLLIICEYETDMIVFCCNNKALVFVVMFGFSSPIVLLADTFLEWSYTSFTLHSIHKMQVSLVQNDPCFSYPALKT